ncbi:nitrate/nitrite transport system substrate-binding protein [Solimonas aquatica]|uniref:Nitrate/nitrite transport system substrate-binding protein n=1 Tax=Solimonas aquatica TaxID=489703 RepID=A0A1H9DFZ1_9GAMM|nr:CmpA/NrtA family ABC transporter substrate-binding protein [Solimonas aquatica]SEQ12410.1 nitrate/nitrite transport system substrate-binding protein [Solimonas aquatica]
MNVMLPFRPEISSLTIGYMPLLDSAPLLWAAHRGYFRAAGLDVELVREVSWASLRDRLAYGALDAAQCLAPMPVAATLGADGVGVPMVTGLCLSQGGSAITFSRSMAARIGLKENMEVTVSAAAVADYVRCGGRLRLAYVFPFSMHHYLLRDWLALGGIDEDHPGIEYSVAPPPQMVRLLESGAVDGFCVGEPWNTAAVKGGLGFAVTPTSRIWDGGAEKVLGVTREWAQLFPQTHRAMIAAILAALQELSGRNVARELTQLLHKLQVVAVPESWIEAVLRGQGVGSAPRFVSGLEAFPRRSQLMWCALQMLRWRQWQQPLSLAALTSSVCDMQAYCDAARALGMPGPAVDCVTEGAGYVVIGADGTTVSSRFIRGPVLDPADPAAYLAARGWPGEAARAVARA